MASVTPRTNKDGIVTSYRVQARNRMRRMCGESFPTREEAEAFAASVDELGWEAAFAALIGQDAPEMAQSGSMTLTQLKQIVIDEESTWERVPEFYGDDRAVLESNVAITLEWARDRDANTGSEGANECYTGLTGDVFTSRVLYCGQPVLQVTLLMVNTKSKRPRSSWFYVPVAYKPGRSWQTGAVAFALARTVNDLLWRQGFEWYMERCGVRVLDL